MWHFFFVTNSVVVFVHHFDSLMFDVSRTPYSYDLFCSLKQKIRFNLNSSQFLLE